MFYVLLAVLVGLFFAFYLFLRRTVLGFKEGMDRGQN